MLDMKQNPYIIADLKEEVIELTCQNAESQTIQTDNMVEIGVQTDISIICLNHLNQFSTNDLQDKKQMKRKLFLESVMKDDESCKFYTGI